MARKEREYHKNFIEYQKFIIFHPNYSGLPESIGNDGKIKWVTAGNSVLGQKRKDWWINKGKFLESQGIKIPSHAPLSPIALLNHPTKSKACQTCGRIMSLEYVYPAKNTLKSINKFLKINELEENFRTIFDIIDSLEKSMSGSYKKLDSIFSGISKIDVLEDAKIFIQKEYVEKFSKKLGPGAMSNCPDRLDGFHSYNKCCRSKEDTGRHASNLNRYGEDRRAYENWTDGDWKAASWLMKVFNQHGVSADHIGPISLGFAHRPVFQPMSRAENSSKGNRMSMNDFKRLMSDEYKGDNIISWHSKPIWDNLKRHVHNEQDVYELCKYMRRNMHHILSIFAQLHSDNLTDLLESFLQPEYANYSIEFIGFNPENGSFVQMNKTRGDITQYSRNAERYKRIAFEQLEEYKSKENRKTKDISDAVLKDYSDQVSLVLRAQGLVAAKEKLLEIFNLLALDAEKEFLSGKKLRQSLLDD